MNLEQNPTSPNGQVELTNKKQQLKELQSKEKTLTKSLPIDTQITIRQKEIKALTNKPTKTKPEEALLATKQKELAELLTKQKGANTNSTKPSDKIALMVGGGIIGIVLISLALILVRNKNKKH